MTMNPADITGKDIADNNRIIIIDDCRLTLQITKDLLEQVGYEVCTASNSGDAFKSILTGKKPSLIIIDVNMPLIQGNTMVNVLKRNKETEMIPILYYSSRSSEELQLLMKETGADGYLTKSSSSTELIETVQNILS